MKRATTPGRVDIPALLLALDAVKLDQARDPVADEKLEQAMRNNDWFTVRAMLGRFNIVRALRCLVDAALQAGGRTVLFRNLLLMNRLISAEAGHLSHEQLLDHLRRLICGPYRITAPEAAHIAENAVHEQLLAPVAQVLAAHGYLPTARGMADIEKTDDYIASLYRWPNQFPAAKACFDAEVLAREMRKARRARRADMQPSGGL